MLKNSPPEPENGVFIMGLSKNEKRGKLISWISIYILKNFSSQLLPIPQPTIPPPPPNLYPNLHTISLLIAKKPSKHLSKNLLEIIQHRVFFINKSVFVAPHPLDHMFPSIPPLPHSLSLAGLIEARHQPLTTKCTPTESKR